MNGTALVMEDLQMLRHNFDSMAAELSPPKPAKVSGKATEEAPKSPPPIQTPNFSKTNDTYADMFTTMKSELQALELHSQLDYLSFYRRAFDIVLKSRNEILFDHDSHVALQDYMHKDPNSDNSTLLAGLFHGLMIKPRDTKVKAEGNELSTNVVLLN
jgi:hypothetical protein